MHCEVSRSWVRHLQFGSSRAQVVGNTPMVKPYTYCTLPACALQASRTAVVYYFVCNACKWRRKPLCTLTLAVAISVLWCPSGNADCTDACVQGALARALVGCLRRVNVLMEPCFCRHATRQRLFTVPGRRRADEMYRRRAPKDAASQLGLGCHSLPWACRTLDLQQYVWATRYTLLAYETARFCLRPL